MNDKERLSEGETGTVWVRCAEFEVALRELLTAVGDGSPEQAFVARDTTLIPMAEFRVVKG